MPKVRRDRTKYHDSAFPLNGGNARATSNTGGHGDKKIVTCDSPYSRIQPVRFQLGSQDEDCSSSTTPRTAKELAEILLQLPDKADAGADAGEDGETNPPYNYLTRGQRKRLTKKDRWLRKFDFVNYMRNGLAEKEPQKESETPTPLGDFSNIVNQLDALQSKYVDDDKGVKKSSGKGVGKRISRKKRNKIAKEAYSQYEAIANFAPFLADPIGSLKQHLQNTLKK